MTDINRSLGGYVPVTSEPNLPPDRARLINPDPEVGARWGRPASFELSPLSQQNSETPRTGGGFRANLPPGNPPTINRYFTAGASVSWKTVETPEYTFDDDIIDGEHVFDPKIVTRAADGISLTWTEPLQKQFIGQLGRPERKYDYRLRGAVDA